MAAPDHIPVLLTDPPESSPIFAVLQPREGETVLDATLGLGGHAAAFLQAIGPSGRLIGLDADARNLAAAGERLGQGEHIALHHANFRDIATLGLPRADIIFADLGLSSPHVDDPARGFTFRESGPLDLRFDQSRGPTAADLLAASSEEEIASALYRYGELKESRRLARALWSVLHPNKGEEGRAIGTTADLKAIIEQAVGYRAPRILPQVFQALRMWVNDELGSLEALLRAAPPLLKPGGRLGIISYHSLEDRMVKQAFRALAEPAFDPVTGQVLAHAPFELLTKKAVQPTDEEVARNPRARSARFRVLRARSA